MCSLCRSEHASTIILRTFLSARVMSCLRKKNFLNAAHKTHRNCGMKVQFAVEKVNFFLGYGNSGGEKGQVVC